MGELVYSRKVVVRVDKGGRREMRRGMREEKAKREEDEREKGLEHVKEAPRGNKGGQFAVLDLRGGGRRKEERRTQ